MLSLLRRLWTTSPNRRTRRATARKTSPKLGAGFAPLEDRITPVVGAYDVAPVVPLGGGYDAIGQYGGDPNQNWDTSRGGSGALLSSFRHVISAKHVAGETGTGGPNTRFRLPGANVSETVIHTAAARTDAVPDGEDLSIVTLKELAPLTLDPFDIYTGSDELGKQNTYVGYGRTGTGTIGRLLPARVAAGDDGYSAVDQEEAQRIWIVGTPSAGSFTLWVPTAPQAKVVLPWSASAALVEQALELLPGLIDVRVAKVAPAPGHPYAGSYEIAFDWVDTSMYPDHNVPTLAVQSDLVGAGALAWTISEGGIGNKKRIGYNHVSYVDDTSFRTDFDNGTVAANIHDDAFWRGSSEAGTAAGDSGSPVFIGGKIAGVLVSGSVDQDFGSFSRSVRVSHYQDFINDLMNAQYDLVLNMNTQPWGNDTQADEIRVTAAGGQIRIYIDDVLRYQDSLSQIKSVRIEGSNDAETISVESLGQPIPITVNANGGTDIVRVVGVSSGAKLTVDGGTSHDFVAVGASYLNLKDHIRGTLNLTGGGASGDDRIEFRDQYADDFGVKYGLNGNLFTRTGITPVNFTGFDSVGIFTGKHLSDVTLQQSSATTVDVTGGPELDIIRIGTGNLNGFADKVTVDGGGGSDELRISDSSAPVGRTHTFSGNVYTTVGQSGSVTFNSVGDVLLFAGPHADTVQLWSSPDGVRHTLNGNGEDDTFFLGTGDLDAIREPVTIYGGTDHDELVLNDAFESTNTAYEVDWYGVTRTGFDMAMLGVEETTLTTSNAHNQFHIHGTPGLTRINAGDGVDFFFLTPDDGNLNQLSSGLILNGQGGDDVVSVDDRNYAGSATYTLTGTSLTRDEFGGLAFSQVDNVWLRLSDNPNTVIIQGSAVGTDVFIDGNGGSDTFRVTAKPQSSVTINGGSGLDRLQWAVWLLPPSNPNSGFDHLNLISVEITDNGLGI